MNKVLSFIQNSKHASTIGIELKELGMMIHQAAKQYVKRRGLDVHNHVIEFMDVNYKVITFNVGLVTIVIDAKSWNSEIGPLAYAKWAGNIDSTTVAGIIFGGTFTGIAPSVHIVTSDIKVIGDGHYSLCNIFDGANLSNLYEYMPKDMFNDYLRDTFPKSSLKVQKEGPSELVEIVTKGPEVMFVPQQAIRLYCDFKYYDSMIIALDCDLSPAAFAYVAELIQYGSGGANMDQCGVTDMLQIISAMEQLGLKFA